MVLLLDDPLEPVVSPPSLGEGGLGGHRIGSVRDFTCRSQNHSIPIFDAGVRLYQSMEVYELIHSGRLGSALSLIAHPRRALASAPGNQHEPRSLMLSAIASRPVQRRGPVLRFFAGVSSFPDGRGRAKE